MLSIIIPTLNEEKLLPRLLESIKSQDFNNYEIIIADANSKDNTKKIALEFGCKVVLGGKTSFARNNGAKNAQGDYLLFLDADTKLPPNFLSKFIKKIEKRNIDNASCGLTPISNNIWDFVMQFLFHVYIFITQFHYAHAQGAIIFSKKWVHEKIGGFDEEIEIAEDHDYARRAGKVSKSRWFWRPRILFSVRRFKEVGRLKIFFLYVTVETMRILKGELKGPLK